MNELSRLGLKIGCEGGVGGGESEFFYWDEGVAIGRHDGSGHDLPTVGGFEFFENRVAGWVKALDGKGA